VYSTDTRRNHYVLREYQAKRKKRVNFFTSKIFPTFTAKAQRIKPTMMKSIQYPFLILGFILLFFTVQGQTFSFAQYGSESGIAYPGGVGEGKLMHQDKYGFLWFCTANGISSYDGYTFKNYFRNLSDKHSFPSVFATCMAEDAQGELWFGSDHHLSHYDRVLDRFDNTVLEKTYLVTCILPLPSGELWIGTNNRGLIRFDPKTQTQILLDTKNGLRSNNISCLWQDPQQRIWVGAKDGGGLHLLDAQSHNITPLNKPDDITCFEYDAQQKTLWIGTNNGLKQLVFNDLEKKLDLSKLSIQRLEGVKLQDKYVSNILHDVDDNWWIATKNGLHFWSKKNNKTLVFTQKKENNIQFVGHSHVLSLLQIKDKSIWVIGWANSITKIFNENTGFQNLIFSKNGKEMELRINALSTTAQKELLVHTIEGTLHLSPTFDQLYLKKTKNAFENCSKIIEYPEAKYGLLNEKLYQFKADGSTLKEIKLTKTISKNPITRLLGDSKQRLWMISKSGIFCYDTKTNTTKQIEVEQMAVLNSEQTLFYALSEQQSGIWLSNWTGQLFCYDEEKGLFIPQLKEKNVGAVILQVLQTDAETIYLGTKEGLKKFNPKTKELVVLLDRSKGLPDENIGILTSDQQGNLWLGTFKGLVRYNLESKAFRAFDEKDGLYCSDFAINSSYKNADGRFFLGTEKGLLVFEPTKLAFNTEKPTVYITDFQLFNKSLLPTDDSSPLKQSISLSKSITLQPEQSVFTIQYAALNYTNSGKNHYAYQLEGFDKTWQYVGSKREVTYTNLNPGTYNFHVKASNNDGVWNNEGTILQITVLPPWYKTWWAYLLYSIGIASVLGVYVYTQRQKLLKEQAFSFAASKFVPHDFLQMLGRKSILQAELGDQIDASMTVLFADIRGYTTLSEGMSPQDSFGFINAYYNRISPIIRENQGIICEYMGDGFMAVFPQRTEDAIHAALQIQSTIDDYNQHRSSKQRTTIAVGIGIHRGDMILGIIGDKLQQNTTVISDAVNTASRIETLTKEHNCKLLITKEVVTDIPESLQARTQWLEEIQVKGRVQPVDVYRFLV
jgi:ligand-binding sensor domain-containing protein/class 3 adenylate cyclase